MKGWQLLVATFLLWPCCSSQNACEEPDEIDFGEIVSAEKAKYLENDRVQYRCNPGYVLEGPEWIQCKRQEWTPHPPKCLAPCTFTKQQLAAKNLFVFGSQRKVRFIQSNQSLQFQCNEGYVLVVPSVRKCVDGYMDLPLCISERGKNCSGPPRIEIGDITTLSEKQYKSGSSVEFRCQNYYAIQGEKRSFCDNGTWTKVPVCLNPCVIPRTELESQKTKVKDELDAPENIFVQHGRSIELTCITGYVMAANSSQSTFVIHCDGTPPVIPKCKEITCNSPRISNGTFRPQRTIYQDGDLIQIRCDTGFTFEPDNGEKVIECTKNGWSPPPKCSNVQQRTCKKVNILHGNFQSWQQSFEIGAKAKYNCHDGYTTPKGDPEAEIQCLTEGWSPEPECIKVQQRTCKKVNILHGNFQPWQQSFEIGAKAKYTCHDGYTTPKEETEAEIQCLTEGWSPEPECIKTCLKPSESDFTFTTTKSILFPGDELHYECKEGFEITKNTINETIVCTEKGWEPAPSCVSIVCEIPVLENGAIEPREDVFYNKAVVHFKCNKGFTRVGSKSAQCYHFGWFPQPAICKENVKHCLALPIIPHSTITAERKAVFEHGDLLEVQCDISFALYGSKIIECVDGEWTPLPTCIEESKTCGRPPRIDNGFVDNVESFIYRHGDTVEYKCNRQYSTIGTNPAKCLQGQWEVPSCLRNCPPPPQLPNAINITEMRVYGSGEEISLECQEHFLLRGPQKIKCEDGKWQTPPRCLDLTK
ncbi:complement factor H-like isoform X2 [Erythrolamprus reginae]|uniref:complement factor H-like isoform X2 n=1 Tax=Erythrolamprus reginae TaxID=121349 RepID=UPI00396CADF8